MKRDPLTDRVIGLAIEVHRTLGPGLLESVYEKCLCYELLRADLKFARQKSIQIDYKGNNLECGFRTDLVIENRLLLELKSVANLLAVHEAQLLTYLKLSGLTTGLILNFNVAILKDGIIRRMR